MFETAEQRNWVRRNCRMKERDIEGAYLVTNGYELLQIGEPAIRGRMT